ncbi:hypothetical protein CRM22_007114 [Opisthorchis felineus]|uniref:Transmembrane protein 26 n=2 Tax=Opisthorchiidae TaxID=6196 RepID=A0A4S2LHS7_OPIFE|nr:hypothetical protein CRM22_007114 [Opisthorchis felineus]
MDHQSGLRKLSSQACDDCTNNDSKNTSGASVSGSDKPDPEEAEVDHQNEDSENIRPSIRSEPSPIDKSVCPSPQTNFRRHTFAANFLHPTAYLHVRRTNPRNSNTAEVSVVEKSPKRSKSVGNSSNIPSNHNADSWTDYPCIVRFCINMCIQGWIALLNLLMAVRAIIVRMGFICFACVAIVTVVRVKNDGRFWLLCITIIPLLLELILAIKTHLEQSTNGMAISKWFSMCNFAYLICACPPIWIIELHHMDQLNNSTMVREQQQQLILNRTNPVTTLPPWLPVLEQRLPKNESITIMGEDIENYIAGLQLQNPELMHRQRRVRRHAEMLQPKHLPLNQQKQTMEQLLLLSVIVGRWLMPREGLSRDQLSQLLLTNIGTAADILELFEAFNEPEVRKNLFLRTVILCLWQASLLQFCFNKTAVREIDEDQLVRYGESFNSRRSLIERTVTYVNVPSETAVSATDDELEKKSVVSTRGCCSMGCCYKPKNISTSRSLNELEAQYRFDKFCICSKVARFFCQERPCLCCETELWAIGISLMLQDLPFLCLRLALIFYFNVESYSNIFFTCKNTLLIMLQLFRSIVIVSEAYSPSSNSLRKDSSQSYRKFSRVYHT